MGWLELLPLLKRLLPLLSRVAPVLETFVVARAANGKDTEAALARVADDVRSELAHAAEGDAARHAALTQTLAEHTESLRTLNTDVHDLRLDSRRNDVRVESIEAQVRTLRTLAAITILLLIVCVAFLLAIFLRHPA